MDANKLPRLFSKGTIAFLADDEEDSRGKARERKQRGWVTSGIIGVWRAMLALGSLSDRLERVPDLSLVLSLSFSANGVIK